MKKQTNFLTRALGTTLAVAFAVLIIGAPAFAEDPDPDKQDATCMDAVEAAGKHLKAKYNEEGKSLTASYAEMRTECADFRTCKRDCRQSKRDAKKACKGLKGKAKRKCKKNARKQKRSCKKGCRAEMKQSGCRSSRRGFWGSVGKAAKKLVKDKEGRAKAKDVQKACKGLYKKGG